MVALPRVVQGLILFSTLFGIVFLVEVYPLLSPDVFDLIAFGWVLFVIDSILTFIRPKISFYLGVVLALIALGETLGQPEHYQLIAAGDLSATATIAIGSVAEALLIILAAYYLYTSRGKDPWAWPGEKPSA